MRGFCLSRAAGVAAVALVSVVSGACGSSGSASHAGGNGGPDAGIGSDTGATNGGTDGSVVYAGDAAVTPTVACAKGSGATSVQSPTFVRNIRTGETGWFSSPAIIDVNGDGKPEIVAPQYSTFVFDAQGKKLATGTATMGRVYAPGVVADLDGDGKPEIVVGGNGGTVAAYDFAAGTLATRWTADTSSAGQSPEARGMAAGDLDHDGKIEVAVTTTNTATTGAQVFVFGSDGKLFQPAGTSWTAWPRYNTRTGPGGDADFNGAGNHGYGEYGENVGIGNIDDDANLEIITTYDDHQINAFKLDGTSVLASSYYTNPTNQYLGKPLGWGQFIRWLDPAVEAAEYDTHKSFGDVNTTMWLQWTASPPNVVDVDGDGKNEVVGVPNAEEHTPYVTQAYAFMVLEGAYGDGSRSARRLAAFDTL
ncbi:MAG: FG-GAP repeat domain-containing protein, partial [Polyangiaceae bacterium]